MTDPFCNKDYEDFINSDGIMPPQELDTKIINFVRYDLNPDMKIVFSKLLGIQAFVGVLTLLFCPQFELSLTNNHDLYHYFHYTFGTYGCFAICGALFIGSGAIFASYLLKKSEVKKIRSNKSLCYLAISLIAVSLFILFGAEIYLAAALAWLIGAILGGLLMVEINGFFRDSFLSI
ncbi:MAG: hypothetical protein GY705_20875 [Bacteroidetes bacterium]|nr:hypothetical protein [Bacteroidota bacterium]